LRVGLARLGQQRLHVNGRKAVLLEVDDIHFLRRVLQDLVGGHVGAQVGLTRGDERGIVVAGPIDGPRSKTGHQADQSVLAPDARRPAELVVAERDARPGWQEVPARTLPHDFLDQDPISSWTSSRPRSARYSVGSGPKTDA
jgi:hypothetical protein